MTDKYFDKYEDLKKRVNTFGGWFIKYIEDVNENGTDEEIATAKTICDKFYDILTKDKTLFVKPVFKK